MNASIRLVVQGCLSGKRKRSFFRSQAFLRSIAALCPDKKPKRGTKSALLPLRDSLRNKAILSGKGRPALFAALLLLVFSGCRPEDEPASPLDTTPYALELPPGFPMPVLPADNELTAARVALGKKLFYDPVLSRDSSLSCAGCHRQELAFADDRALSPGVEGRLGFRNSPTLANVAYLDLVNKDGGVVKLDVQALVPIEDHNEMDFRGLFAAERLLADPAYVELSQRAYARDPSSWVITRALAAFQRTLISGNARYDRARRGEQNLTEAEARGQALFFSERTQCSSCHGGFNFTENAFENNGRYAEYADNGRWRVTGLESDKGKFRVPTLRNIAQTAPYMHDGSLPDLRAVIDHYDGGGAGHPNQSEKIRPLGLTETEKADLIAFLKTLTDSTFLTNPAFAQ